ncbi:alpha/beta hydrolase [Nocardia aurantia]|uniref:Diacylglycerol acyltransferase/mycolyltransferase Ag85A n=1 Tax=Nocardia aurantia TaxID=2585199 RepID=A0A7K0DHI0_9NOCA|nr:alpha/beta hydrolase family protein [Nocardia aurantia]MQY25273.1 Diacylglycerol acyltransferase/mycolyltransferase Ag85A [Nocardia aurantia]
MARPFLRGIARRAAGSVAAVLLTAASWTAVGSGIAAGEGPAAATAPDGSYIERVDRVDDRRSDVSVYSAAMRRTVRLAVVAPARPAGPRPVLYLLNGAEDGLFPDGTEVSWLTRTDIRDFTAGKDVTLVDVLDGRYTYYTDWVADDPVLGRNRWTTFLTAELPPLIDAAFDGNGRNAIAGVSMSATSALALAEAAPGLYRGVGSFSGCAQTGTDPGRRYVQAVVLSGGGNPWNMWGADGAPAWTDRDPSADANLAKLRGTELVVTAGDPAAPGRADGAPTSPPGRGLEAAVADCTRELAARLDTDGIAATVRYLPGGQHAWPYWQQAVREAWPALARALGR